jgi:uncharacterized protein (TIGR02147 family)
MISVKDYMEYRDYLRDYFAEMKKRNSCYSLRFIGSRVNVDPSHLVKIFQRQRHIGNSLIDNFIKNCGLSGSDADYFANLVLFNKAKNDRDSKLYFEKLIALKGVNAHSLDKNQYEYYTKWYYSAILTLLDFYPFTDNYATLAEKLNPPITEAKAKKSILLLKKLGLINKTKAGTWNLTSKIITTGEHYRSFAVKTFQEETMRLAMESLDRHPSKERNISTVTITLSEKNLSIVNEAIRQFRETLLQIARDEDNPDKVYQLNVQLFPLTKK